MQAQDTIRALQQELKEAAVINEKLLNEVLSGGEILGKEREATRRESDMRVRCLQQAK